MLVGSVSFGSLGLALGLAGWNPSFWGLDLCLLTCSCVCGKFRCPTFHLFCVSGHQFEPQPENLCAASAEGRSIITPRQTIKLLPRSDRWQMPEGLFIFCLLIRAASRGGGAEVGEGPQSDTPKRMKVMAKGNTLFQRKY